MTIINYIQTVSVAQAKMQFNNEWRVTGAFPPG